MPVERFEIVVRGRLESHAGDSGGGLRSQLLRQWSDPSGWARPDQARLHELFQLLSDLDIELVSVNPAGEFAPIERPSGQRVGIVAAPATPAGDGPAAVVVTVER